MCAYSSTKLFKPNKIKFTLHIFQDNNHSTQQYNILPLGKNITFGELSMIAKQIKGFQLNYVVDEKILKRKGVIQKEKKMMSNHRPPKDMG